MTDPETYLLDANVFIEAKRRYYAFDICPGFWDSLVLHHSSGRIGSIDRVQKVELEKGKDDLTVWAASEVPDAFFAATDEEDVLRWYAEIVAWVQSQAQFFPEAKTEFAGSVDGWLIAYAKAKTLTLVTHEVLALEARKNVPIPNVCEAFDIRYADTFDMLRALETRFILQRA